MLLHEKKVFVGTFVPRKEREKEMGVLIPFTTGRGGDQIMMLKC